MLVFCANSIFACGCNGPMNEIEMDIDSSDAILIGVITEISLSHKFHLADQIGNGLKYLNLDVLGSNKGLNQSQLKVTVFDYMSNSSCQGLHYGKEIGDTILIFAKEFKSEMIGSYLCGRHPTFRNLSDKEKIFIDTAKWYNPRAKYEDPDKFIENHFPTLINLENENQKESCALLLILSVVVNLFLGFYIIRTLYWKK